MRLFADTTKLLHQQNHGQSKPVVFCLLTQNKLLLRKNIDMKPSDIYSLDNPSGMGNTTDRNGYASLPQRKGFSFRRFEGPADYPAMVAIIMSNMDDPNTYPTSLEDISADYENMSESVPVRDLIFAFHDQQPAAYCRTACQWEESVNSWIYSSVLNVHHDFKHQGLEEVLLGWLESQAIANHHAFNPGANGLHHANTPETDQDRFDLLQKHGYRPARYFENMKRDLEDIPDYPLPEGIILRPATPSQFRQVWDAGVEAFKDHWGATTPPESEYQEWIANKNYFQPYLWKIAWDGDEIAGMVLNYINLVENEERKRLRGYTESISVRRLWRGKGIAKALIARSMKMMKALGMEEVALGVDSENLSGATKLYYALGYRSYSRSVVMRKPFE